MAWRMAVRGTKTRLRKLLGFILFFWREGGRWISGGGVPMMEV